MPDSGVALQIGSLTIRWYGILICKMCIRDRACTHWLYRDITLVTSQGEEVEAVTMAATVGEYLDSVSYTHLDVYKRQAFSRFRID